MSFIDFGGFWEYYWKSGGNKRIHVMGVENDN